MGNAHQGLIITPEQDANGAFEGTAEAGIVRASDLLKATCKVRQRFTSAASLVLYLHPPVPPLQKHESKRILTQAAGSHFPPSVLEGSKQRGWLRAEVPV